MGHQTTSKNIDIHTFAAKAGGFAFMSLLHEETSLCVTFLYTDVAWGMMQK